MKLNITFDKTLSKQIVEAMGYEVDTEGYITQNFKKVDGLSNEPVHIEEFAGFVKTEDGVKIVRNNLFDMMEVVKRYKD